MIDEKRKLETFDAVFYEAIGGRDVATMLTRHHVDHASYRTIAGEFRRPVSTVIRIMRRARDTLKRLKLLPRGW